MKTKAILVLVAMAVGWATVGKADPIPPNALGLKLSDGIGAPVVVFDGTPLDANPAPGAVTYIGLVGGWNLNVSTGIGQPAQGNPFMVNMDLNSVNSGVGILSVELWNAPYVRGLVSLTSAIGGTTDGSVSAFVYNDLVPFGHTGGPIMNLGPFGVGAFSAADSVSGVYAMGGYTEQVIITHRERGITSFNMTLRQAVPDGGLTVAMLGIALAGLGIVRRRLA